MYSPAFSRNPAGRRSWKMKATVSRQMSSAIAPKAAEKKPTNDILPARLRSWLFCCWVNSYCPAVDMGLSCWGGSLESTPLLERQWKTLPLPVDSLLHVAQPFERCQTAMGWIVLLVYDSLRRARRARWAV